MDAKRCFSQFNAVFLSYTWNRNTNVIFDINNPAKSHISYGSIAEDF
jgi:hypothetical protein